MAELIKVLEDGYELKDGGSCSQAIKWNKDGTFNSVVGRRPTIGCSMLVGSSTARSYSNQDYWLTTEVTEIIEESEQEVKFKTKKSTYIWRS